MKKLFLVLALLFTTTFAFSVELKFMDIAKEGSTYKEVKKTLKNKKLKFSESKAIKSFEVNIAEYEGIKLESVTLYFDYDDKFKGFTLKFLPEGNESEIVDKVGADLIEEYEISAEKNQPNKVIGSTIYQVWSYSDDMKYRFAFGGNLSGELFIEVSKL